MPKNVTEHVRKEMRGTLAGKSRICRTQMIPPLKTFKKACKRWAMESRETIKYFIDYDFLINRLFSFLVVFQIQTEIHIKFQYILK